MKIIRNVFVVAALLFSASFLSAQTTDANVTITKVVETSADNVWTVLRKMDDIQNYSSLIAKVKWTGDHGVGGERVCYPPKEGQGYFKERIVDFSDEQRTYSYALIEGVPAKGMVNNFKVVDLGYNKSMIVWTSKYEQFMENPQMDETQFLGFLNQSVKEMIDNVATASL
ncbi:MAG: SRPBCC family protein [Bacteroidota bacterium]